MDEIKKSDCVSVLKIVRDTGISRNTLNGYMEHLGIKRIKFPFDTRVYISGRDYSRLCDFLEERWQ